MAAQTLSNVYDVLIVGGGAAGLMTAVQLSRQSPNLKIALLDGAKRLGAKILISGGGRCNVTNAHVVAKDFQGGSRNVVRRVLKVFSAKQTVQFFEELGVSVHEEEHGKLFPDSNKARTVLESLIHAAEANGVKLLTNQRVVQVAKDVLFIVETESAHSSLFRSDIVVFATGGRSIPKTGSDGFGYELARSLGHSITPTIPALAPLLLQGDFHEHLSGISQHVELTLTCHGSKPVRVNGSLLWTHFGISGPAALDISRHWHAANLSGNAPVITANFFPDHHSHSLEQKILAAVKDKPKQRLKQYLSANLPNRFVDSLLEKVQIPQETPLAELKKEERKRLINALTEFPLPVTDSRGFGFAEATAGGVPLNEISPSTMESRCCQNLYLVGEILDVDGRLGGFNFQWAWSSGTVAANAIAKKYSLKESASPENSE